MSIIRKFFKLRYFILASACTFQMACTAQSSQMVSGQSPPESGKLKSPANEEGDFDPAGKSENVAASNLTMDCERSAGQTSQADGNISLDCSYQNESGAVKQSVPVSGVFVERSDGMTFVPQFVVLPSEGTTGTRIRMQISSAQFGKSKRIYSQLSAEHPSKEISFHMTDPWKESILSAETGPIIAQDESIRPRDGRKIDYARCSANSSQWTTVFDARSPAQCATGSALIALSESGGSGKMTCCPLLIENALKNLSVLRLQGTCGPGEFMSGLNNYKEGKVYCQLLDNQNATLGLKTVAENFNVPLSTAPTWESMISEQLDRLGNDLKKIVSLFSEKNVVICQNDRVMVYLSHSKPAESTCASLVEKE